MANVYLGMDAVIVKDGVVFGNVKDVTLNLSRSTADVSTRANDGWRAQVGTLRECTVSFQMVKFSNNSDEAAIIQSFLANSTSNNQFLKMAILDSKTNGSGPVGEWSVTSCNRGENLEDAITYDVELSLSKFYCWQSGGSGTAASGDVSTANSIVGDYGTITAAS